MLSNDHWSIPHPTTHPVHDSPDGTIAAGARLRQRNSMIANVIRRGIQSHAEAGYP